MQRKFLALFVLIIVAIFLAGCDSPEEELQGSKGIFYEIVGGKNQAYLFGSIHAGHEDMYPIDLMVDEAFSRSDVLVLEIDIVNTPLQQMALTIFDWAKLDDGRKMAELVPEELFNQLVEQVSPLGLNKDFLNMFQPWFAEMLLSDLAMERAGLSADLGVEYFFLDKAEGKEILGLETVEDQISPYLLLTEESQIILLENAIEQLAGPYDELYDLIEYWQEGNVEAFAELRRELVENQPTESIEAYHRAMLDGRDEMMAAVIEELLENDSGNVYFIVVGALHLAGENSIVDLLREKGYELRFGE